jgi:hypothetical protein
MQDGRATEARRGRSGQVKQMAGIALAGITALALTGCSGGTTWKADVTRYTVINPADLAVVVQVTNTGGKPAVPTCTIDASDASGAYNGVDVATLKDPVTAGATTHFVDNLVITQQGAGYVTEASASCTG